MSQIEQNFRQLIAAKPEIEKCYTEGLINRRALARYLIQKSIAQKNQMNAVVAMLRRYPFEKTAEQTKQLASLFHNSRIAVKDNIVILEYKKEKSLMQKLQKLLTGIDYEKGDTLKIVVGSSSVTVFVDEKKQEFFKDILEDYTLQTQERKISELSLQFPPDVVKIKGTLSVVTKEFLIHDIPIRELLTASTELLIYVKEDAVIKAYEVLKGLQR